MRAAFGDLDGAAVVDGEEDVRRLVESGQGFADGEGVGRLHEHEGHGGPEEDDVGMLVLCEVFALEIPVVRKPLFSTAASMALEPVSLQLAYRCASLAGRASLLFPKCYALCRSS